MNIIICKEEKWQFNSMIITLAFTLFCATPCFAQTLYQWDDGTRQSTITSAATREALALDSFDVQPGEEQIISISGVWAEVGNPGATARVVLFDDPNEDGNPLDTELLVQTARTIGPTGSSFSVSITPTIVDGRFFAGVTWLNPNGNLWLTIGTDTDSDRSWLESSEPGGTINLNDLSSDPPNLLSDNETIMLRAEGVPAPESIPTMSGV